MLDFDALYLLLPFHRRAIADERGPKPFYLAKCRPEFSGKPQRRPCTLPIAMPMGEPTPDSASAMTGANAGYISEGWTARSAPEPNIGLVVSRAA